MSLSPRLLQMARRRAHARAAEEGFTLAELLVGAVLSVLVVTSLGAIALITELRMGRESEVNQNLRDNWNRALTFITNEAQHAYWIRTEISSYPCGGEAPSSPLVLEGPPKADDPDQPEWTVVYGVRANSSASTEWRGFNRLVRCGPPFVEDTRANTSSSREDESIAGNLDFKGPYSESVIVDQLAEASPFARELFDTSLKKDRDVQISLFLSRRTGASYPPAGSLGTAFHTQIHANRNPGFDVKGNPDCNTSADVDGNEQPNNSGACNYPFTDSQRRMVQVTEYNLGRRTGNVTVNSCRTTGNTSCIGPAAIDKTEVIYFKGKRDDYTLSSCDRSSCTVSNGSLNAKIYDGNVLVFYDRIVRL